MGSREVKEKKGGRKKERKGRNGGRQRSFEGGRVRDRGRRK